MITGELKSRIDKLWTEFWTGGITNPLTVIEQISFLMFSRMLDITETRNEKKAARTNKPFKHIFIDDQQVLRWSHFKQLGAEQQECVVLRFLQGLSVAETALAMGKNEGAIKALQYRAVRALGRMLPEDML